TGWSFMFYRAVRGKAVRLASPDEPKDLAYEYGRRAFPSLSSPNLTPLVAPLLPTDGSVRGVFLTRTDGCTFEAHDQGGNPVPFQVVGTGGGHLASAPPVMSVGRGCNCLFCRTAWAAAASRIEAVGP